MGHLWGLWIEGASLAVESFVDSLRPMQVLSALIVINLLTLYTVGREMTVGRLLTMWIVSCGSIVLWTVCAVALHEAGL